MIKIDKDKMVKVCEESNSMSEACAKLGLHFNTFKRWAVKYECYNTNQSGKGCKKSKQEGSGKIPLSEITEGKHPQYQTYKLKQRLLECGVMVNQCFKCGLTEWNGEEIKCELHHKDGNRTNHKLKNLEIICPNCHSQSETFRAKNIKT